MSLGKGNQKLPADILEKLSQLDTDLKEEEITTKGYCKRKWALLQKYASKKIARDIEEIQRSLANKSTDEKAAYSKMLDLLRTENWFINTRKILHSTENVVQENDLLESSSGEPVNDSLKTTILKNYFNKVVNNINNTPTNINSNTSNINKRKLPTTNKIKDKRFKTNEPSPTTTEIASPNINCDICNQPLNNILKYKGHPKNAVDELVALTNPKLLLFTGDENDLPTSDQLPNNKITQFAVYDKNGHLCSFDSGLIEKNTLLYFSGYLKPIYDENPSARGGIPVKDMGPIDEWFTSGFDGGEKALLGFNTAYGIYYLMQPSKEYKPIMEPVWKKIYLSKIVIEFLLKNAYQNPTYEDLLTHLNNCDPPKNISHPTEENLLKNAQFICEQVSNFDSTLEEDDLFIATTCMMSLIKLAGVTLTEQKEIREEKSKNVKIKKKSKKNKNLSKATTTELVRKVFDSFFPEQLDINSKLDCGKCKNCKKAKSGAKDIVCLQSRSATPNGSDTDESSNINDSYLPLSSSKRILHPVTFLSDPITIQNGRTYYSSAKVGSEFIKLGDHVILQPDKTNLPLLIAKIVTMWDHKDGKFFHANIFCRGVHTVLGEISDRREIFQVDDCEDCPLGSIVKKAEVEYKILPPDLNSSTENDSIFFCQKRYDRKRGRFENLFQDKLNNKICDMVLGFKPCSSCKRRADKNKYETAVLEEGVIKWRNEIYKPGVGVYLLPGTFEFKKAPDISTAEKQIDHIDEDMYPEYFRKKSENVIGIEISEPFCIGYISEILTDLNIQVQKLYRPENTHSTDLGHQLDINTLYWTDEQITVPFSKVAGQCHIVFGEILDISPTEWSTQGPNRFYFLQSYNSETKAFLPVTDSGRFIGQQGKSRSKKNEPEKWGALKEPLRTMDVFAGCGGLSEGLHQSGVATTKWAIENEKTAALAYKENNPETIVYSEDCNDLLTEILSGALTKDGQSLPSRGDVELLVGGPPCQGFSGMNRFNAGQYSLFKNSLIVSYLSYCDYYRPKFFILENVRNFVTFKRSMVLKLTLRCLLAMGYQCAFGVLQAGNYGVPQIRRRSIILAAAPGEILPEYPEPLHVFTSKRANPLDIVIDHCRYNTGSKWLDAGAPFRTVTVRDAMSDLPAIPNGCSLQNQKYDSEPVSHFQRLMRTSSELLDDHICKEMAPLVEARMSYIPTVSGSDWRDLPNIEIKLSDGSTTNKLRYEWHDKRNGKNSKGSFRGVCPCASKKPCDSSSRQDNTIIPWCLPHTANRHNNWAGLYGRLEWDGVFNTTVTNPEPMAKQGRVLHPVQHRVVSVRECARSQGFPDRYRFHGNVMDKHRQVGNAVPPPMGKAIGREILKCVVRK